MYLANASAVSVTISNDFNFIWRLFVSFRIKLRFVLIVNPFEQVVKLKCLWCFFLFYVRHPIHQSTIKVSNDHSRANLSNSSTRQNGDFGKLAGLDTFADISQPVLVGLNTFVDIRQPSFIGLARLAKAKFCK